LNVSQSDIAAAARSPASSLSAGPDLPQAPGGPQVAEVPTGG
jgi:hypothetical protein